jgi:uncharacterized membrane protein
MSTTAQPMIFCRHCGYPLNAMRGASRCPECALEYDPRDRATYHNEEEVRASTPLARARRSPLTWLVALAPFSGALDAYFFRNGAWAVGTAVLVAAFALAWCNRDSQARGVRLREWHVVAVFLLPLIAVPVYLVYTRRLRGVFALPIVGLLLLVVSALSLLGHGLLASVAGL